MSVNLINKKKEISKVSNENIVIQKLKMSVEDPTTATMPISKQE
jgi:hypothetical protein